MSTPMEPPASNVNSHLGLRDMINHHHSERHDSAYYGTPSEASSKRMENETPQSSPSPHSTGWLTVTAPPVDNSGTSFNGPNGYAPGHPRDKSTPSPTSGHLAPQSVTSPGPAPTSMSLASIVSPPTSSGNDTQRYSHNSYDSHRGPGHLDTDDRRDSVDSRMSMNQGFNDMRLHQQQSLPPSPYAQHNQNSAAAQRLPHKSIELQNHRMSNGYTPSADRTPHDIRIDHRTSRIAPTITGPTQGTIARAAEPTKGQAWAFPEDENRGSTVNGSLYTESRRTSFTSINSSQYTDSRLPAGQMPLDVHSMDGHRMYSTSSEYLPMHRGSIRQHKKITDLQEDSRSTSSQPYSRTPELRQSHKLAERKRRTEMKELFEQLREMMPQERGAKASKWEILTRAISEIKRLNDNVRSLSMHFNSSVNEIEASRREIHGLRLENAELRAKLNSMHVAPGQYSQRPPSHPTSVPSAHSPTTSGPPPQGQHYNGPPSDYGHGESRPELPPIRAVLPPPGAGPDSMSGVQYDNQRR